MKSAGFVGWITATVLGMAMLASHQLAWMIFCFYIGLCFLIFTFSVKIEEIIRGAK